MPAPGVVAGAGRRFTCGASTILADSFNDASPVIALALARWLLG